MYASPAVRRPFLGLAALFTAAFTTITTETLPMGLLPAMSRDLEVTQSWIGLLVGAYALLIMIVTLPLVALTSRWPRRRLLVVIMAAFAVGNLLMAVAPNYPVAVAARLIAGLGHGVLWSAMASYATRLVTADRAGRAVAVVFAANSAALTLGVPLGTVIGDAAGWRIPFAILAAIALLLVAAAPVTLPDIPGDSATSPGVGRAARIPGVRGVLVITALVMTGHFVLHTYVVPVLVRAGVPERGVGPALFAFGLAGIAGTVAAGAAADRPSRTVLPAALGLMTVSVAALALARGGLAVAATAFWGAAYAALPILLQTAVLKVARHAQTGASALFIITFNVSIAAGSIIGGQLLTVSGPWSLPAVTAVLAAAACATAARRSTRRLPPGPAEPVEQPA
ncbi:MULTISPECIES: MFS transporter [Streptosporangium]|uniref:MFS family arabinose efflux permease n=1 Tax=Streptosporangium brasiliense TaxID=47480 RepID=A0ABT9R0F3_9ACTN|nr:MFS transporter [Streptosporangium brasiliense]MDP9862698.1 putative MFS family arabinose efflux permease [Streptosporangium brasiliense]